jgi:hypothetical protein
MSGPWLKFYPTDWRADPALRMCSLAARGLWMEMLCIMHEATPYGSLRVNGRAVTDRQLAALAGGDVDGLLAELEDAGVFSREDDGTIFSRRMQRDAEKAAKDKANGKGGGNPSLKRGVNPPDKAQKPEARSQTETTPSGVVSGWRDDLEEIQRKLLEAVGENGIQPHGALNLSPILGLIAAGVDLETDILPTIRARATKLRRPANSWAYFVDAIRDAHTQRLEAGKGVRKPLEESDALWLKRLALARANREWSEHEWGPPPGTERCRVPRGLLQAGDGHGWKRVEQA